MKKYFWYILFVILTCGLAQTSFSYEEKDINEDLLNDEEIIKYLDFLESMDYLEEDLGLMENYEEVDQVPNSGENDE